MRLSFSIVILAIVFPGARTVPAAENQWTTYTNPRFGTTAEYPSDLFTRPEPPPANADGQSFQTADGRAKLAIYGFYNTAGDTPSSYLAMNPEPGQVTAEVGPHFFKVSGKSSQLEFVIRCNFAVAPNDVVDCYRLEYPGSEHEQWQSILDRLDRSLRGAAGRPAQR